MCLNVSLTTVDGICICHKKIGEYDNIKCSVCHKKVHIRCNMLNKKDLRLMSDRDIHLFMSDLFKINNSIYRIRKY